MKEYVIPASQIKTGFRRTTASRNEIESASGTSYGNWSYDYSSRDQNDSNRIAYEYTTSRTRIGYNTQSVTYKRETKFDDYRIDLNFDVSGVPADRIQSVKLRAKLTDKNSETPLGYFISSVGNTGGVFDTLHPHYYPINLLGTCELNNPVVPYIHDTTLSELSDTGWYTLWNEGNSIFSHNEILNFDLSNFYLVITTDEQSAGSYTVTYDKGTYGTGENETETKTEDVVLRLKGAIFTRSDYTQTGWSVNADGSTKDYNLNDNYTNNANITLYPYWTRGHVATTNVLFIMTENGLQAII
jgi:hypothetical protein